MWLLAQLLQKFLLWIQAAVKSHCCCVKLPKNAHHPPTGSSTRGVWPTDTFQPARPSGKADKHSILYSIMDGWDWLHQRITTTTLCLAAAAKPGTFKFHTSKLCQMLPTPNNTHKKNLLANTQSGEVVCESIRIARKIQFVKIPCHSKVYQSGDCVWHLLHLTSKNATLARGIRKFPIKQHVIICCWEDFPSVSLWMTKIVVVPHLPTATVSFYKEILPQQTKNSRSDLTLCQCFSNHSHWVSFVY